MSQAACHQFVIKFIIKDILFKLCCVYFLFSFGNTIIEIREVKIDQCIAEIEDNIFDTGLLQTKGTWFLIHSDSHQGHRISEPLLVFLFRVSVLWLIFQDA